MECVGSHKCVCERTTVGPFPKIVVSLSLLRLGPHVYLRGERPSGNELKRRRRRTGEGGGEREKEKEEETTPLSQLMA